MARSALGVDLGQRTITVAEVRRQKRQYVVTNVAGIDLPYGHDTSSVVERARALRAVLNQAGIRERRAWVGIQDREQVVGRVQLTASRGRRRNAELRNYAAESVSGPLDMYVYDAFVVPTAASSSGNITVLACMPRDVVASAVTLTQRADLRLRGIDLQAFGAMRAVGRQVSDAHGTDVLIDLGATGTTLLFHRAGVPLDSQVLGDGCDDIVDALARALSVTREDAAARLRTVHVGRSGGVSDRVATEAARRLVAAIARSLRATGATHGGRFRDIVAVGGGVRIEGLLPLLEQGLGHAVRSGSPFDRVRPHRIPRSSQSLEEMGPQVATAVGLALAGLG